MKKYSGTIFAVLLTACSPGGKISVTNVNDAGYNAHSDCLYALPLSAFAVTVTARQESFIPGPFYKYAAKYLGIKDAVSLPHESWSLTEVSISPYVEADPDYLFNVKGSGRSSYRQTLLRLNSDSLVLLPEDFVSRKVFTNTYDPGQEPLGFTDISIKRNFEADKGMLISEILPDSSYIRQAEGRDKKAPVAKTLEQKAEEAANFIIKIRKRRFKLISGQYDFIPDGEALGRAVEELNRTEEDYLALFIGRKRTSFHTRTFHYVPESVSRTGRTILFRFSDTEGFLETGMHDSKPVLIVIEDLNKIKEHNPLVLTPGGLNHRLVYRIPDQAVIRILFGEQTLVETMQPVYQFGMLVATECSGREVNK